MRFLSLLFTVLLLGLTPALAADAPAAAAAPAATTSVTPKPLTDEERAAIENVIQDYLVKKHPEVVLAAVQELQKREQGASDEQIKATLKSDHDKIYNNPDSPVVGNPKGDVEVIEFFDYQCPYCKTSQPSVDKLLKEDNNVKVIYKDFPILGEASTIAAKAALASVKQNKYPVYHDALMKAHFTHGVAVAQDDELVYTTAKDVGLDVEKLKKDAASEEITKMVGANLELASKLNIRGTPMFIINDQVFPGALTYDQLKKAVDDARAAKKKP